MSQRNLFGPAPGESTSSPAASRVPTSASPVAAPDSLANALAYGSRCFESSASYARATSSLKTFLLCAVADLTSFSLVWKRQATPRGRSWWVLGRSARRTGESESGLLLDLWPTPIAGTSGGNRGGGSNREGTYRPGLSSLVTTNWATPQAADAENANAPRKKTDRPGRSESKGGYRFDLKDQVAAEGPEVRALANWGTPRVTTNGGAGALREDSKSRLEDQVHEDWATPTSRDWKSAAASPETMERNARPLSEQVGALAWPSPRASDADGGRANPIRHRGESAEGGPCLAEAVGMWPTPTTQDAEQAGSPNAAHLALSRRVREDWPTPTAESYGTSNNGCPGDGREAYATKGKPSLEGMARQDWPTPQAADSERQSETMMRGNPTLRGAAISTDWPTPHGMARGDRENGPTGNELGRAVTGGPPDPENLNSRGSRRGSLNPDWVETLMGAPPGWTDLPAETVSALLATRIRRTSRKSSGGGS